MLFRKLRDNLSLTLLFLIVLVPIITMIFIVYEDFSFRKGEEIRKNEQIAQVLANSMDSYLSNVKATLISASKLPSVQNKNRVEIQKIFESLMLADNHISLYWFADLNGKVLAKYPNKWPDKTDRPFIEEVSQDTTFVSEPRVGTMTGIELITVSALVKNHHGEIIGVLGASIPITELKERLHIRVGTSGYPILVTKTGKFLVHPQRKLITQKVKTDDHIFTHILKGGSGTLDTVAPFDGKRKLFSYVPLKEAGWIVIVIQPLVDFQASSSSFLTHHLLLIILVVVIIALATYYLILIRKKEEEARILQAEKLSLVGQLAAGMAHEICNPLTSIRGFTQLAAAKGGKLNDAHLDIILTEVDRIESIVKETMLLAKPSPAKYALVQVAQVLKEACQLMETQALLKDISLKITLEDNLPPIQGEANHLKQVFINLIKNSLEAVPTSTGSVSISLGRDGKSLITEIQDNGSGIPPEILDKLGTPFLSTKDDGTGLGLMVSYRIIQNHGGSVSVKSTQPKGTTFIISLPIK